VQRVTAGENRGGPILRVDMKKGANALHRIGCVGEGRVAAVRFVVLAAHGEGEPIPWRHHDADRPDLAETGFLDSRPVSDNTRRL